MKWLLPEDIIKAGPYRLVIMAMIGIPGESPDASPTVAISKAAKEAGFRILGVHETDPLPNLEGYDTYAGYLTADTFDKQLLVLGQNLGLIGVIAAADPVGIVEQKALEAAWVAKEAGTGAGEELVEKVGEELEKFKETPVDTEVKVPWTTIVAVGLGAVVVTALVVKVVKR